MERSPYKSSPTLLWCDERRVIDGLPEAFALERSESEWLVTLLSAGELKYIFEGKGEGEADGKGQG